MRLDKLGGLDGALKRPHNSQNELLQQLVRPIDICSHPTQRYVLEILDQCKAFYFQKKLLIFRVLVSEFFL